MFGSEGDLRCGACARKVRQKYASPRVQRPRRVAPVTIAFLVIAGLLHFLPPNIAQYVRPLLVEMPKPEMPGPIEQALIGTKIRDADNPFEVGRIIRSFDPCLACSVHVLDAAGQTKGVYRVA